MTRILRCLGVFAVLALLGLAVADDVGEGIIKVFLFAAPAFTSQVTVDVRNNTCYSLDNNLIDGMVRSVLIGGRDVVAVLRRDDHWYCMFFDNYDCAGGENSRLIIPDGANNLASAGWETRVHGIRCINES